MARLKTGTAARQGHKGKRVLYVLVAAVTLAVVAGAGMLMWQGKQAPPQSPMQNTAAGETKPSGSGSAGERPGNTATPSPAQPKAQ